MLLIEVVAPPPPQLNLSGCRDTLTDLHVGELCAACPLLLELVVSDAVLLTDATVAHVCAALRRLRSFRDEGGGRSERRCRNGAT